METASSAYRPVQFTSFVQRWQDLRNTAGNKAVGLSQRPKDAHLIYRQISEDKNCDFQVQFWVFTSRCFCWKLPPGNLSWCIPVDALGKEAVARNRAGIVPSCGSVSRDRREPSGGFWWKVAFSPQQSWSQWTISSPGKHRFCDAEHGGTGRCLWDEVVGVQTWAHQEGSLARSWERWPGGSRGEGMPHMPRKQPQLGPQEEGPPPRLPHVAALFPGLWAGGLPTRSVFVLGHLALQSPARDKLRMCTNTPMAPRAADGY